MARALASSDDQGPAINTGVSRPRYPRLRIDEMDTHPSLSALFAATLIMTRRAIATDNKTRRCERKRDEALPDSPEPTIGRRSGAD